MFSNELSFLVEVLEGLACIGLVFVVGGLVSTFIEDYIDRMTTNIKDYVDKHRRE